ncbi:MAG: hypothetical protein JWO38_3660 [Gemmataceae bacterium]|nr:hypothetical protein [Gemmataceae bacterium]
MATSAQWSHGYARQADADFKTFQALEPEPAVEVCHKLQFLQMACEKLVKAHLCGEGTDPSALQTSHAYVAGSLPVVLRQTAVSLNLTGPQAKWVLRHAKHLAQEVEVLAPAVKRGGTRPDNCEYPWEDAGGELHVPLDWSFHPAQLLVIPAGRTFLKLIRAAINDLMT